jgi:uncharacterized protein (TIGR00251 family)
MRLTVRVLPRSSRNAITWDKATGSYKAYLTAPPVDGAANEALVALLAESLKIPKRQIRIVHGATGRQKTVEIMGLAEQEIEKRLGK